MSLFSRLFRLLLHPSQLRKQGALLVAFLAFRIRYAFLRVLPAGAPSAGKVLIVNFTDAAYHAKTEGILAHALSFAGAMPVVLTRRSCGWAQRYFRACGITEFVFLDDYLSPSPDDEPAVRAFLSGNPSNEDMLAHTYDNINIGANAFAVVLKHVRAGSVDLSNPEIEKDAIRTLVYAREAVRAARALLRDVAPATVIFTETGYTPHGELFAVAVEKGMNPIQYIHSQRLDAITFKRYKTLENMVDPVSISRKSWKRLQAMPWTPEEENAFMKEMESHYRNQTWFTFLVSRDKTYKSPEEVRALLGLDSAKKTAVIFSHVVWDASFYYGKNLFNDYDDWLVQTVKVACENPAVQWVIKLHPDYIWQTKFMKEKSEMRDMIAILANVGTLPPHVTIVPPDTDISTYSFFGVADFCLTVRGTVGLECPCFGITVFAAGRGRYSDLGFTEDFLNKEEYLENIRHIQDAPRLSPERVTLARKHAYGLFMLRPIPFKSFEVRPLYKNDHVVDHKLMIHASSRADIENDPGLRTFADWVLHSQDEDYIALPA